MGFKPLKVVVTGVENAEQNEMFLRFTEAAVCFIICIAGCSRLTLETGNVRAEDVLTLKKQNYSCTTVFIQILSVRLHKKIYLYKYQQV